MNGSSLIRNVVVWEISAPTMPVLRIDYFLMKHTRLIVSSLLKIVDDDLQNFASMLLILVQGQMWLRYKCYEQKKKVNQSCLKQVKHSSFTCL